MPAVGLVLAFGAWSGHATAGAIAAGAAFSVGFGAARELRGSRIAAMFAATAGMTFATFAGTLAGRDVVTLAVVAALAAAACASLALLDEDVWWVVLQWVIALLVAGAYPGTPHDAAARAADVLVGGAVQLGIAAMLAMLVPGLAAHASTRARPPSLATTELVAHGLRAAVAVTIALWTAEAIGLAHGYWAPMTVLLILKPGLRATRSRGLERLAGTIAGCGAATLFAMAAHDARPAIAAGFIVLAGVAYAMQKAQYALFSAALTGSIVLLISLGPSGALVNAEQRVVATLLGGAIALLVARVGPDSSTQGAAVDRIGGAPS